MVHQSRPSSVIPDMTCTFVDKGRIQLLDKVGQGTFGAVYRARYVTATNSSIIAVKILTKRSISTINRREVLTHVRVNNHPNIAKLRRCFQDENFFYLVLDYCPGGDLWRAISEKHIFVNNDARIKNIFLQIIDAMRWCHKRGVYHRDLKPNNILINLEYDKVWLTDFGLSTPAEYSTSYSTGTQQYRSPECNNFGKRDIPFSTRRNDIWALGMILLNMVTGTFPWAMTDTQDGWYLAYRKNPTFIRYTLPISVAADEIFRRCFVKDQNDCISLDELYALVENVDTFFMSNEDIAAGEVHLRRNARRCNIGKVPSNSHTDPWSVASDSIGSLLDDSDDSDEHSNGLHSRSLLAAEEGWAPDRHNDVQLPGHPLQGMPLPTSMSIPGCSPAVRILPMSGGIPPTDAFPSREYGQLVVPEREPSGDTSDTTQTPTMAPTTPSDSGEMGGDQGKSRRSFWSKVPRKLKMTRKRLFTSAEA